MGEEFFPKCAPETWAITASNCMGAEHVPMHGSVAESSSASARIYKDWIYQGIQI